MSSQGRQGEDTFIACFPRFARSLCSNRRFALAIAQFKLVNAHAPSLVLLLAILRVLDAAEQTVWNHRKVFTASVWDLRKVVIATKALGARNDALVTS